MRRSYLIAGMIVVFLACFGVQLIIFVQESAPPEPPKLLFRKPVQSPSKSPAPALAPASRSATDGTVSFSDVIGGKLKVIGTLGAPLGTRLVVEGLALDPGSLGSEDTVPQSGTSDHFFRVYRINEQWLNIPITVLLGDVSKVPGPLGRSPRLPAGQFFRIVGFETGYILPPPWPATGGYTPASGPVLQLPAEAELVPLSCEPIATLVESVESAIGQSIAIVGLARSVKGRAYVLDDQTLVLTDANGPWPVDWEGRQITVQGTVSRSLETAELMISGNIRELVSLDDQVGKPVRLRGLLWSTDSGTVFLFRGVPVQITGEWPGALHGLKVVAEGQLEAIPVKEKGPLPNFGVSSDKAYRLTGAKITPAGNADR